jgi:hypothetical protein
VTQVGLPRVAPRWCGGWPAFGAKFGTKGVLPSFATVSVGGMCWLLAWQLLKPKLAAHGGKMAVVGELAGLASRQGVGTTTARRSHDGGLCGVVTWTSPRFE